MANSARARSTCAAGALSERLRRVSSWRSSAASGRRGSFRWRDRGHLGARGSPHHHTTSHGNRPTSAAWLSGLGGGDRRWFVQDTVSNRYGGGGKVDAFTWGSANRAGIKHPLSEALPGLSILLDPPKEPQTGDSYQPRVARPSFGASDRFVVAPGQERTGFFHMPTGQSGHPLSPYYNLGHEAWMKGQPTPFLPGETKWRLYFQPE